MTPRRPLLVVAALFLAVRAATIVAYSDTLYYYGMIGHQFGIAEAAYHGHWFAHDKVLSGEALAEARREGRFVPIEEWKRLPRSGRYTTFPAADLPGYGYLIAFTSRWLADDLTTRYALAVQVLVELASLLLFLRCAALGFGRRAAWIAGLVYAFGYPFIWPIASLPMRDVFIMGTYAAFLAAAFAFLRLPGWRGLAASALLVGAGSLLLWVRPHGYYFFGVLLPLAMLAARKPLRERAAFCAVLVAVPWLAFGRPLERFNLRHYGVAATDALGRTLWQAMGIARDNPYGFVLADEAMLPWIEARYGRDVEYASPEMNRLLGDYAREVIRRDPAFYLKTMALSCLEMLKTPLDFVPPFRLVEYASSGLSPGAYARAHPGSFAFKVANRVLLVFFFYGGLWAALRLYRVRPGARLELALLLTPLAYAVGVQATTHFEARYMATAAFVLVLPWACAIEARLERDRSRAE